MDEKRDPDKKPYGLRLYPDALDAVEREQKELNLSRSEMMIAGAMALSLLTKPVRKELADMAMKVDQRQFTYSEWPGKSALGEFVGALDAACFDVLRTLIGQIDKGVRVPDQSGRRRGK